MRAKSASSPDCTPSVEDGCDLHDSVLSDTMLAVAEKRVKSTLGTVRYGTVEQTRPEQETILWISVGYTAVFQQVPLELTRAS